MQLPEVNASSDWLTGWKYRKSHEIYNATNSGAEYQVKITVINGSGSDNGDVVYIDNKTRSDFADLRFTDDDGVTLLSAWNQTQYDGKNITVWVKIKDDLSSSNATIYLYYGKDDATAYWNGDNTFVQFHDFEDQTSEGFTTIAGTFTADNEGGTYGYVFNQTDNTGNRRGYWNTIFSLNTFRVLVDMNKINSGGVMTIYLRDNSESAGWLAGYTINGFWCAGRSDVLGIPEGTTSKSHTFNNKTWYHVEILYNGTGGITINADGDSFYTNKTASFYPDNLGLWVGYLGKWDNIALAKYSYPNEPTHGTWGQEQTHVTITFFYTIGGQFRVNHATLTNGSQNTYPSETIIELCAVTQNRSWIFISFNWSDGSATTNPYNYTVSQNMTIWLYFRDPPPEKLGESTNLPILFVGACFFFGLIGSIMYFAMKKR